MSTIMNCTPDNPMPEDRDQMGQHWYHHGSAVKPVEPALVKAGDSQMWKCPNCEHEFSVTRRGKVSIKQIHVKLDAMRAQGWQAPEGDDPQEIKHA